MNASKNSSVNNNNYSNLDINSNYSSQAMEEMGLYLTHLMTQERIAAILT